MKVRITKVPDKSLNARKWKHAYGGHIFAFGTPDETVLPEEFAYTPEIQDEIVATPKINLSKGWRFNKGYYNDMVQNIIAGNDPLINRENYNDIYFSGKRRAGRKLKKAIAKADAKQTKLDNEAWQEQQQKQYRDYIINGLRNNTLTPEEFGNYTSYGIDRYGVPIAAPIVGAAVAGAAAPAFSALRGVGRFVPKVMDYTFNPVGAALRTGVEGATKLGASTVAGMSVPTASMVATGTDIGMMSVYGAKAAQEMKERGITPENATSFGMSVIPAFGVPIAAGYRYVKPLIDEMPSLRSAFTSSAKVGGNGITPWQSYMARQVLNPDSLYSKVNPYFMRNRLHGKLTETEIKRNILNDKQDKLQHIKDVTSKNLRNVDMFYGPQTSSLSSTYEAALRGKLPNRPVIENRSTTSGVSVQPLAYKTSEGNIISADVPVFTGNSSEHMYLTSPEVEFPANVFSPGKPTFGVQVVRSVEGGSSTPIFLDSPQGKSIADAVNKDMEKMESLVGDDLLTAGSGAIYRRYGVGVPGDYDGVTTPERWNRAAAKLGFSNPSGSVTRIGTPTGTIAHNINGSNRMDPGLIFGDDTVSWGKEAEEYYALLHPEDFVRVRNQTAMDSLRGGNKRLELPISNEQLYQEIKANPEIVVKKTVMDNVVSGKYKHSARVKSLIDADPELVSASIKDIHKAIYGKEISFSALYPNMKFDNIEANKAFLEKLELPTSWAESPEKMKAATEVFEASMLSVVSGKGGILAEVPAGKSPKEWIETLVNSGTSATDAAGSGANAVQGSKVGGGQSYSAGGVNTVYRTKASYRGDSFNNPMDMYNALERQLKSETKISEHYTSEQLSNADALVEKYLGKGFSDFANASTQDELYWEIRKVQRDLNSSLGYADASKAMKDITKELDLPSVRRGRDNEGLNFIMEDREGVKSGGYVGSFVADRNGSGELVYGMDQPPVTDMDGIETPRVFTNIDISMKEKGRARERVVFSESENNAEMLKAGFESRLPGASDEARKAFGDYVDNLEKHVSEIKEASNRVADELGALWKKGVNLDEFGKDVSDYAAGLVPRSKYAHYLDVYNNLSDETKTFLSFFDDSVPLSRHLESIKNWKTFEDTSNAIENILVAHSKNGAEAIKYIDKMKPYLKNKEKLEFGIRNLLIAMLSGGAVAGASAGISSATKNNYHNDDDYSKYAFEVYREENPFPENYIERRYKLSQMEKNDGRKARKTEEYKRIDSETKEEMREYFKKERELNRRLKKDYRSIANVMREYEKERKRKSK